MVEISAFQGISHYGQAYQRMLEQDVHLPGTVDRMLNARMIKLCGETHEYLYTDYTRIDSDYTPGSRPALDEIIKTVSAPATNLEKQVQAVTVFCANLHSRITDLCLEAMVFGGTEEEIIERGSDWCTDLSRVACSLFQVAGFPARIVNLFNLSQPYSGHVITEVYRNGKWGAVDPTQGIIYLHSDHTSASTWEVMQKRAGLQAWRPTGTGQQIEFAQFAAAGIVNYYLSGASGYIYTTSKLNEYYREILEKSEKGWPEGFIWLNGEDR